MIMLSGCILKLSLTKQVLMEITFQCIYDTTLYSWYDTLLNVAVQAVHNKDCRRSDLIICRDLLEAFPEKKDNRAWKALHDCCTHMLSNGISYLDHIESVWQKTVFSCGTAEMQHDINRIPTIVADKLKDLDTQDLYLSGGLPGIGMYLLNETNL